MHTYRRIGIALVALLILTSVSASAFAAKMPDPIRVSIPLTQSSVQEKEAIASLGMSDDVKIRKADALDVENPGDAVVATGDLLIRPDGTISLIAVIGDVLGNGNIGLSQLVCLAEVYKGLANVDMLQFAAGDYNGDGRITLSDVTALAQHVASLSK